MPINFAVAIAVLHLPGWSPAALDQFAIFGLGDPTATAVRYAIAVPVVLKSTPWLRGPNLHIQNTAPTPRMCAVQAGLMPTICAFPPEAAG